MPFAFLRGALVALATAVIGFHLRILWARLADGSVLDPLVAGRWLASIAIGLAVLSLRRRGVSLLRGRAALIVWLLVTLLHGIGLVPAADGWAHPLMPAEAFLLATPLGVGVATFLFWAGALALERSGKTLFALLVRRAPSLDHARVLGAHLLTAIGPRAPPR